MTSNLRIASREWVQTQSGAIWCFLEHETILSLLSTGWFQERIQECFYKITAFYTIELKYIQYKLIQFQKIILHSEHVHIKTDVWESLIFFSHFLLVCSAWLFVFHLSLSFFLYLVSIYIRYFWFHRLFRLSLHLYTGNPHFYRCITDRHMMRKCCLLNRLLLRNFW